MTRAAASCAAALLLFAGCAQILDVASYSVDTGASARGDAEPDAAGGGVDADLPDGCEDLRANRTELENACTASTCIPFDNVRVPLTEGRLRPLPPLGSDASTDADAGSGATADAGDALPSCAAIPPSQSGFAFPPTRIFAIGSSALSLFVGKVAQVMAEAGVATVVYQSAGSCAGVEAMVEPGDNPMAGTAVYFDPSVSDPTTAQLPCRLEPGTFADVGISDVFASTCTPSLGEQGGLPNTLEDHFGPIQVMNFVVPLKSSQVSISYEAAYNVWGFGNDSRVAPWVDETYLFQRNAASGTQAMIAAAIDVPAERWLGETNKASSDVLSGLVAAGQSADSRIADRALGILSSDYVDDNRDKVRALAFRDMGQGCGYLPDSTSTSKDKNNVRDGHYPLWGPSHLLIRSSNGVPLKAVAKQFVSWLSGETTLSGVDVLQLYAQRHVIPNCAMRVTRTTDGKDYSSYRPQIGCGCYFDAQATGSTRCRPCASSNDCRSESGAPNCNVFGNPAQGYCEP